jgi:lysophospholipase L1-like esterase
MRHRRRAKVAAGSVVGGAVLAVVAILGLVTLGVGALTGGGRVAGADEPGPYYLAIGGSESVGVQPDAADPRGAPTDEGYADDLTRSEAARWPGLQLVELGCPGETASAALGGGGACHYDAGSQIGEALAFLHAHPGAAVLATVDLGFNDLRPCLAGRTVDEHCVSGALAEVGQTVTTIVDELESAGGPSLDVVGIEKYDPYLGAYTAGPDGQTFAEATLPVFSELNAILASAYTGAGATVADVPGAFDTADQQPTTLAGYGTVPTDVARVCTLTWACAKSPFPHNVHPNAPGYQVVAGAVAATLDRPS